MRQEIAPAQLSTVQESVFSQCWVGSTYLEIANCLGYDSAYIRSVGARLWQLLSNVFGQQVTKKNFQVVLNQLTAKKQWQAATAMTENQEWCCEMLLQQGALVQLKAPKPMDKAALMSKVLSYAEQQQHQTVLVNLRLADSVIFTDLERFLTWFCAVVADQFNLDIELEKAWKPVLGSNYNCTIFFDRTLLPALTTPVVIALENIDVLFEYIEIATNFFSLLQVWCQKAQHSDGAGDPWHLLKIIVI